MSACVYYLVDVYVTPPPAVSPLTGFCVIGIYSYQICKMDSHMPCKAVAHMSQVQNIVLKELWQGRRCTALD